MKKYIITGLLLLAFAAASWAETFDTKASKKVCICFGSIYLFCPFYSFYSHSIVVEK
jgi:hypothetical protein